MFTNSYYSQMEKYHGKPKEREFLSQTGKCSRSGVLSQKHAQSLWTGSLIVVHTARQQKNLISKYLLPSQYVLRKVLRNKPPSWNVHVILVQMFRCTDGNGLGKRVCFCSLVCPYCRLLNYSKGSVARFSLYLIS